MCVHVDWAFCVCFPLSAGLFMHTQLIYLHLNQANSELEILFSLQKGNSLKHRDRNSWLEFYIMYG